MGILLVVVGVALFVGWVVMRHRGQEGLRDPQLVAMRSQQSGFEPDVPRRAEPHAASATVPTEGGTKTCPDCAEQIQAAARKCRYCGKDFRGGIAPTKGLVFTELGDRYVFGAAVSPAALGAVSVKAKPKYYCIWDRQAPERPIRQAKATQVNYAAVRREFEQLEPDSWLNPEPPACPKCGQAMVSGDRASKTATGVLAGVVVGGMIGGALGGAAAAQQDYQFVCNKCRVHW